MSDIKYLTIDDVIRIHEELVMQFGGTHGIRDIRLIESAVFRPRSGYYQDIVEQTAALFESLLMNHPFLDGNKRTALAVCDVFLRINGKHMDIDNYGLVMFILEWISLDTTQRFKTMCEDLGDVICNINPGV